MTENRARACGKQRGVGAVDRSGSEVTDGVNAAKNADQRTAGDEIRNRTSREAERDELRIGDLTTLALGHLGDPTGALHEMHPLVCFRCIAQSVGRVTFHT
jgi:hypothetical protein